MESAVGFWCGGQLRCSGNRSVLSSSLSASMRGRDGGGDSCAWGKATRDDAELGKADPNEKKQQKGGKGPRKGGNNDRPPAVTPNGKKICYAWNRTGGCSNPPSTRGAGCRNSRTGEDFAHVCSEWLPATKAYCIKSHPRHQHTWDQLTYCDIQVNKWVFPEFYDFTWFDFISILVYDSFVYDSLVTKYI